MVCGVDDCVVVEEEEEERSLGDSVCCCYDGKEMVGKKDLGLWIGGVKRIKLKFLEEERLPSTSAVDGKPTFFLMVC